jgi:hypothetical protein
MYVGSPLTVLFGCSVYEPIRFASWAGVPAMMMTGHGAGVGGVGGVALHESRQLTSDIVPLASTVHVPVVLSQLAIFVQPDNAAQTSFDGNIPAALGSHWPVPWSHAYMRVGAGGQQSMGL